MEILEIIYLLSGILVALFFLFTANILRKEKQEAIKSRIFLKYDRFKAAFYIALVGAIIFLLGNLSGFSSNIVLSELHGFGEIIYNLALAAFVGIIYSIIRVSKYKEE